MRIRNPIFGLVVVTTLCFGVSTAVTQEEYEPEVAGENLGPGEDAAPEDEAGSEGDEAAETHEGTAPSAAVDQPADYAGLLRTKLGEIRQNTMEKLEAKLTDRQESRMSTMAGVLGWFSLAGVLLLFLPFFLMKRHPDRKGVLFKYSVIAALTFVIAVNLFAMVLVFLRTVQGAMGAVTNPQVAITEAAFDTLDENAEELAEIGPLLLEAPLAQLESGEADSLPVAILHNAQKLKADVAVFKNIGTFFKSIGWMFGYVPIVLTLLAVALFLANIRHILVDIVKIPAMAAAGDAARARSVLGDTFRKVGREMLASLLLVLVLVLATMFSGILLTLVVAPAVEAFLAYTLAAIIWLMVDPGASTWWIYLSLGGSLLFLVLNVLVVLISTVFYLGKAQKIFRRRFHDGVPLRTHGRFWKWGTLGLLWAQLLPFLFILGAQPLVEALMGVLEQKWVLLLVSGPVILLVGFVLLFWALRGWKAITFLFRYKLEGRTEVVTQVAEVAETAEEAVG